MVSCLICKARVLRRYSDYQWHNHKDKAICLQCYSHMILRNYLEKITMDPNIGATMKLYLDPSAIALNIWRTYSTTTTCIQCMKAFEPKFSVEQLSEIREFIAHELRAFDGPVSSSLLGIVQDLKEEVNELQEEVQFYKYCNENLKLKLTIK